MDYKYKESFNPGDIVVVHKPDDIHEYPMWIEDDMDQFDGMVAVVSSMSDDCAILEEAPSFYFLNKWLEIFGEEADEVIEASDISLLF